MTRDEDVRARMLARICSEGFPMGTLDLIEWGDEEGIEALEIRSAIVVLLDTGAIRHTPHWRLEPAPTASR